MKTHKDLDVWQKSILLVTSLYSLTSKYPSNEIYGITSQIRRAAVSIPANISEGAARSHRKEFLQFIGISIGSAAELETLLLISNNLKFLEGETYSQIRLDLEKIIKMLINLKRSLSEERGMVSGE
jgi:four helix bundle protein